MADDITEPAQPNEGQGGEATDAPYAEQLSRFPEEVRGDVEEVLREFDGNTTRKFQEASEYRKGWEPYEQLGVNRQDPGEVEWALQMLEAAKTNPTAVWDWAQTYAQQHGLTQAEAQQLEEDIAVDPSISQLLEQQLAARVGPLEAQLQEQMQWRQAQEQQASEKHVQSEIRSELDTLKGKHGNEFDEALVDKFVANHMHEKDPRVAVQKAFADSQAFRAQIEKQVLQSKANSSPAAESGGTAAAGSELPKTLKEANRMAAEQMREARRIAG